MSGGRVVTVSVDQSQISTDITNPAADGEAVTTVYVTVKQAREANGEPLNVQNFDASNVTVTADPATGVVITQPTGTVGADGTAVATFTSTNAATISIGAEAFGATITGNATVVVGGGDPVDPPSGDPFYTSGTTEATVRENDNGFTWGSGGSRVTVQEVPAGRTGWGLRFRYGADPDAPAPGSDSSAEQRFNLGRDCAAVWIEYSLYIPANFAHRTQVSSTNNKFLMIWNTAYGSGNGTWQGGYEYTRAGAAASNVRIMSTLEYGSNADSVTNRASFTDNGKGFIGSSNPLTPGNWHTIRMQFQRSSASGVADGVMRMWIDGTLFAETFGLFRNLDNIGDTVLRNGYFMGWSNSGYAEVTDFYIHGATFYDSDPEWTP